MDTGNMYRCDSVAGGLMRWAQKGGNLSEDTTSIVIQHTIVTEDTKKLK